MVTDMMACNSNHDEFVRINVCGMTYETLQSTLLRFPSTLLANKEKCKHYFVESKSAYYFDRNRQCFEAILYFYHSGGTLIRPSNIPMVLFAEEIAFYGLGRDAYRDLQANEGYIPEKCELPKGHWQRKIWQLFEFPDSSIYARCVSSWSITVIIVSIVIYCMETMPVFAVNISPQNMSGKYNNSIHKLVSPSNTQPWFSFELGCIIWFTIEYMIRFITSPNKWRFLKSFLNIIDLTAILPYYISMAINSEDTTPLSVLRVVRLVRVFRIFKLSRHSLGLKILGQTLKASVSELCMLVFFLFLGVILFSSAIYYAENGHNDMFTSIPDAFWYSLVTMTTVGFGDKVPQTFLGQVIGSMCAVCGVLTIALPVPVIVSNFEFFYKRDRLSSNNKKKMSLRKVSLFSFGDFMENRLNDNTKL